MQVLLDTLKTRGELHHAYCIQGGEADVILLRDFIETSLNFPIKSNPDFWHRSYESFGIDEGRELQDLQRMHATGETGRKIFIIQTSTVTREAQNALLKMFEEPTRGTHFFLVIPSPDRLLPTLKSRFELISKNAEEKDLMSKTHAAEVQAFLQSKIPGRLEQVKKILEALEKEKMVKSFILAFLDAIELELHRVIHEEKAKITSKHIEDFLKLKGYAADRSSSLKLILESIALLLPETF